MAKIKLTLPGLEIPVDGKQVTFVAPCDCSVADGIQIDGVDYDIVDSIGRTVPFGKGVWDVGAVLTVVLDVTNHKAYLQNQNGYTRVETLTDATRAMYGLNSDATPNTIFQKLIMPHGYYGFDVTTVFEDGTPVPYVVLNGLEDLVGGVPVTDEKGRCNISLSASSTPTVSVSGYIGVIAKEETISAREGYVVTPVTIVLERDSEMRLIQSSKTLHILPGVPVDMCIVGGGAGGRFTPAVSTAYPGGGGGYAKNILNVTLNNPDVVLIVGAGGGRNADGGNTSIEYDGVTETANGATGTTGNGNGSYGDGGDGTVWVFNDESLPRPGGGGGGGIQSGTRKLGGADFGGQGANYGYSSMTGEGGKGPGGGGGGGYSFNASGNSRSNGNGAGGGLYIRVNHPTEVSA